MGKTSQRRATQIQDKNIGCTWGLIRMFYSHRDPKLILDRKQGSRRHSFGGFPGRGHSRKKSRDFEEIDEDRDKTEDCGTMKPTVKRFMEGELGKLKESKKIPNDEVQRILADLGHDVCLDKSTMQNSTPKSIKNAKADISIASSSGSLDPNGSNCMKQAKEDNVGLALSDFLGEVALSDFLGEVYKYHDEGPNDDCMRNSELCPELNSIINTKLNKLNNPLCDLAYEKIMVSEKKELTDNKHLHNRQAGNRSEPMKMLEKTNIIEDTKTSNQHELATKTHKEGKNILFWKKDKSSRRHTPDRSSQPVNKIVILKPNPKGGFGPTVATTSTCLHQQSCTIQAPEYSAAECSTFSVKEVRRRFRIVTGENRKGRPSVNEDDVRRAPCRLRDSVFTIKKDLIMAPPATTKNDVRRPLDSSKQKKTNDASSFYAEAKKHLTEILKDKSYMGKYPSPAVEISGSLVGMLSLPQCSTSSSPGSSPRVKHCIELSPEDKYICTINKIEREESAKERNRSEEVSESVEECRTGEAQDKQADQERRVKEETTRHEVQLDIVCTEETDNSEHSETVRNAQCIPAEQHRCNSPLEMMEEAEPGKEHAEMFPGSPENAFDKLEPEEPETPRQSASLELMSQEENREKQEQPSPVSVLDPFFDEDVDSPDNKGTIKCEMRQDVLKPQFYPDVGSDQGIFREDKDARLGYIKAVLELSELYTEQNSEIWNLQDELISTCLFEELHQGNQTDDIKLFFDRVCEAITVIKGTHFRNTPCLPFIRHSIHAPPVGQNLVSEINKHIEGHLRYQFASTLNQLAKMDLEGCSWMNLRTGSEEVYVDTCELLLDELIEDATYDLCI